MSGGLKFRKRRCTGEVTSSRSNPSLQRRLVQNWCPLRLRTRSSPHPAQTARSRSPLLCFSALTICSRKKTAGWPAELTITSERSARPLPPVPVKPPAATIAALGFVLIGAFKTTDRPGLVISSQSFAIRRRSRKTAHENTRRIFCVMSALPPGSGRVQCDSVFALCAKSRWLRLSNFR